jgi:hypothetical protein
VVLKIVHKNKYGFFKGRTIQDCLAWAFEFLFQCEKLRKEIILLKLDFAKTFDIIDHSTMVKIMRQMGFNDRWLRWIEIIFGSGKSDVLLNGVSFFDKGNILYQEDIKTRHCGCTHLNGVPGRQFHCERGVRQGDHLYPL